MGRKKDPKVEAMRRRVVKLRKKGLKTAAICKKTGLKPGTVRLHLRAKGAGRDALKGSPKEARAKVLELASRGLKAEEIAEQVDRDPRRVYQILQEERGSRRPTPEENVRRFLDADNHRAEAFKSYTEKPAFRRALINECLTKGDKDQRVALEIAAPALVVFERDVDLGRPPCGLLQIRAVRALWLTTESGLYPSPE